MLEQIFGKPMVDFTAEELSSLFSSNFESVFHLCQLSYPLLKASGGAGSGVFTSSVSGFVSLQSMSVQGATKSIICPSILQVSFVYPRYQVTKII